MDRTNAFMGQVRVGVLACAEPFSALDVCAAMKLSPERAPAIRAALSNLVVQRELTRKKTREGKRVSSAYRRTSRFKTGELIGAGQVVAAEFLDNVVRAWARRRAEVRA